MHALAGKTPFPRPRPPPVPPNPRPRHATREDAQKQRRSSAWFARGTAGVASPWAGLCPARNGPASLRLLDREPASWTRTHSRRTAIEPRRSASRCRCLHSRGTVAPYPAARLRPYASSFSLSSPSPSAQVSFSLYSRRQPPAGRSHPAAKQGPLLYLHTNRQPGTAAACLQSVRSASCPDLRYPISGSPSVSDLLFSFWSPVNLFFREK
jgi:hypothetical protein